MGDARRVAHRRAYINVMELLVAEEFERQCKKLPGRVLKYVKRSEVETYALNRLPALYASSEKGLNYQYENGSRTLKTQISNAVRQAFAAVQVDPIRLSTPLQIEDCHEEAEAVLQALKDCLRSPELDWESALRKLQKLQRRGMPEKPNSPPPPAAHSGDSSTQTSGAWRPGTFGKRLSWQTRHHKTGPGDGFNDESP